MLNNHSKMLSRILHSGPIKQFYLKALSILLLDMGLLKALQQMKYRINLRRVIEFIEHSLAILQHKDLQEFYPRLNLCNHKKGYFRRNQQKIICTCIEMVINESQNIHNYLVICRYLRTTVHKIINYDVDFQRLREYIEIYSINHFK